MKLTIRAIYEEGRLRFCERGHAHWHGRKIASAPEFQAFKPSKLNENCNSLKYLGHIFDRHVLFGEVRKSFNHLL